MSRINFIDAKGGRLSSNVPGVTDVARPFAQCAEPGLSWRVPSESFRERSGYTMLCEGRMQILN